jgi:hypothetical protein
MSLGRDQTPNKMINGKAQMLQTNSSLSSMENNSFNMKGGNSGRNIKTP